MTDKLIPAETCGKPLQRNFREQAAVHAVVSSVRVAVGEIVRQCGDLGSAMVEAYGTGVSNGMSFLPKCARRKDHADGCDEHAHRGVDYDCEECGKRAGFFVERGFRRCKGCGYPGQ